MKIIILLLIFNLFSCGKRKEELNEVSKARIMLNNGKTDEAIIILNDILDKDSQNEEAIYLLISSYVFRGGVNVYSLLPLLKKEMPDKSLTSMMSGKQKNQTEFIKSENNKEIIKAAEIFKNLSKVAEYLSLIPTLDTDQINDLEYSLKLLDNNKNKLNNRSNDAKTISALTAFILSINIFKDLWNENGNIDRYQDLICQIDLHDLILKTSELERLSNYILNGLQGKKIKNQTLKNYAEKIAQVKNFASETNDENSSLHRAQKMLCER